MSHICCKDTTFCGTNAIREILLQAMQKQDRFLHGLIPQIFIIFAKSIETTMEACEIQNTLAELSRSLNMEPKEIKAIAESGSSRQYYRISTEKGDMIGTFSENIEENEAFFSFSQHFHTLGLNVPKVLAINAQRNCYLQQDLGDDTLFDEVQKALLTTGYTPQLTDCFKKVLHELVRFQVVGNEGLDYSKAYPSECFDRQAILDDLNYFKYYFVKPHDEIIFNETRLNADFKAFADHLSTAPNTFFMYRDFQSRNIMLKEGLPYFIDFQGGKKGPLQYDVVSLLYQVKAQMPQAQRDELVTYYKKELSAYIKPDAVQFDAFFTDFVYLRLMQVLGAYGFRGLIQKKAHFLESIPFALKELLQLHHDKPLTQYTELQSIINQLASLEERYSPKPSHKLTVTVNSFSFKKGYPDDFSGNGGGFVFDCRALPNPGREARFKTQTGRDPEVIEYLLEKPQTHVFLEHVKAIVSQSVDNYIERNFSHLMLSFGCTGGQHRSVFFAQSIYDWLKQAYPNINLKLKHRERKIEEERKA